MARLRIGTRGSRLALAQAEEIAGRLAATGTQAEIVPIVTAGDRGTSPAGSAAGVKGLFVAEIVRAVQRGEVDLAVHSATDLPSEDPENVEVVAVPERADPGDVLVLRDAGEAPAAAVIGTSSLRRRAQLVRRRPDLRVVDARGNVDTRLRRLEEGRFDGLVLAAAGLRRLGISVPNTASLPTEEMVPAPGQGALAVQARPGSEAAEMASRLDHGPSRRAFEAERRLVALLGGGCRLPLGAYAEDRGDAVRLLAVVVSPDGAELVSTAVESATPEEAARRAAEDLRAGGADRILREAEAAG